MITETASSRTAPAGASVSSADVLGLIEQVCPAKDYRGKRVLLIVPDGTRTAPIGLLFKTLHDQIGVAAKAFDVLIALGTHPPMSEQAICERLQITRDERSGKYAGVNVFNHAWDNPAALKDVGTIPAAEISELSNGLFSMPVEVDVNRRLFDYDQVIIVGPVFPHEVVGFSGGNKYLFPGVSGPEVLNFFHWLGAVMTNPMIIGNKWTPVRRVVDRAAALVKVPKLCFCLVVDQGTSPGSSPARPNPPGTRPANSRDKSTSPARTSRSTRFSPARRQMCKTRNFGRPASACISSNPSWRTAAIDHLRSASPRSAHQPRKPHRSDRLPLPRLLLEAMGPVQAYPVGRARALHARARHRHV